MAQYGAGDGEPVLVFHGLPGSRRQRAPDESIARELGARLLHFDRPGIGRSAPAARRSIAGFAADLIAACDTLGLARVRVAAVSGGTPYALAFAALAPQRTGKIAIVSGLGPRGTMPARELRWPNRFGLALAPRFAWLLRPFAWRMASIPAEKYLNDVASSLNATDRELLADPAVRAMFAEDLAEAFAQSSAALVEDLALIATDWGFDLGAVRAPVRLWHGSEDRAVPPAAARALAARLPCAELSLCPGEGHFLAFPRWREILGWLMR
jgi:pimeloyl-ACP methyl ester carboxylesterase